MQHSLLSASSAVWHTKLSVSSATQHTLLSASSVVQHTLLSASSVVQHTILSASSVVKHTLLSASFVCKLVMKSVQPLWLLVFCPFLSHSLFAQVHIFCWRHSQKCLLCIVWSCLWKYDRNACFVCIAWYVCESMTGYKWLKMWCKIRYEVFFCLFFVCVPGEYILCVLGLNKFRTKESCVTLYHVLLETGVCSGWVLSVFLPSLGCVMKERLNSGLCLPSLPDCGWVPDGTSRDSGLLAQFTWLWLSTWWYWWGLGLLAQFTRLWLNTWWHW